MPGILIYQFEAVNFRGETKRTRSRQVRMRACFLWQHILADTQTHTWLYRQSRQVSSYECAHAQTIYAPSSHRTWSWWRWWICSTQEVNTDNTLRSIITPPQPFAPFCFLTRLFALSLSVSPDLNSSFANSFGLSISQICLAPSPQQHGAGEVSINSSMEQRQAYAR